MKTFSTSTNRQGERGFMIAALLAILSLMVIYTAANIRTLNILNREIKAVEKKQIQRLKHSETRSPKFEPAKRAVHSTADFQGQKKILVAVLNEQWGRIGKGGMKTFKTR